jgi:hypothetical protein
LELGLAHRLLTGNRRAHTYPPTATGAGLPPASRIPPQGSTGIRRWRALPAGDRRPQPLRLP